MRWLLLMAACAQLPVLAMAADTASSGTGGGAAPAPAAPTAAALQAAYQQQRGRCLALQVAAVRTECLRQAERDLASGMAALKKPR